MILFNRRNGRAPKQSGTILAAALLLMFCVSCTTDLTGRATDRSGEAATKSTQEGEAPTDAALIALERYHDRLDENGQYDPFSIFAAKDHADQMNDVPFEDDPLTDGGIWRWTWLGPGNVGGRVRTVIFDPGDPNHMWLGAVAGGIWETTNGGGRWQPVNDFLGSLSVAAMTIDPVDPLTLYAGTGEMVPNTMRGSGFRRGLGVFRSTDGGQTWGPDPLSSTSTWQTVAKLVHHPTQSRTLFAAYSDSTAFRVRRSTNAGQSWNPELTSTTNAYTDIEIDPADPTRIIVSGFGTVQVTTNDGGQWDERVTGQTNELPLTSGRCEVAIGPSSVVFVSIDQNGGQLWRSTDGGTTWRLRNIGTNYFIGGGGRSQGGYDNALWVSPNDPNLVVVGGIDLWRSRDGGLTLTKISRWQDYDDDTSAHADHHLIVHHPSYNGAGNRTVFFTNDGGIQKTNDIINVQETSGWINLANNLGITQFVGGAASPGGGIYVGGATDNGLSRVRSGDGADGWHTGSTGDGMYMAVNYDDPNIVYGNTQNLNMFKSITGGDWFFPINNADCGECGSRTVRFRSPFRLSPHDPDILVAGAKFIYRTNNGGDRWIRIRTPQGVTPFINCSAIDFAPSSASVIWVGYDDGTVSRSSNSGGDWTDLDDGGFTTPPDTIVTDIAVNPNDSAEAIVSFGGSSDVDGVWLVRRTRDIWSWQRRMGSGLTGLPAIQVNTVVYHPLDSDWIYAGTDLGIYASEDKGLTWNRTPRFGDVSHDGPVHTIVEDLFFQGKSVLVAATHGRGMFRARVLPTVFADHRNQGLEDGTEQFPYNTILEALNASGNGTVMSIYTGTYDESGTLLFNRRMKIVPNGGPVRIR